jgi:hypothetical protein
MAGFGASLSVLITVLNPLCGYVHVVLYDYSTAALSLSVCVCFTVQGGWSALMWASYKGRVEVAQLLLEKGASPNITGQVLFLYKELLLCIYSYIK